MFFASRACPWSLAVLPAPSSPLPALGCVLRHPCERFVSVSGRPSCPLLGPRSDLDLVILPGGLSVLGPEVSPQGQSVFVFAAPSWALQPHSCCGGRCDRRAGASGLSGRRLPRLPLGQRLLPPPPASELPTCPQSICPVSCGLPPAHTCSPPARSPSAIRRSLPWSPPSRSPLPPPPSLLSRCSPAHPHGSRISLQPKLSSGPLVPPQPLCAQPTRPLPRATGPLLPPHPWPHSPHSRALLAPPFCPGPVPLSPAPLGLGRPP